MERFSQFLINEERSYLGHRVGNVLTSLQDLQGDLENLGSRHMARLAEEIVNQIRKILHSNWNPKYHNQLKELQKVAVAIQKTIDDRGDLREIIPAAAQVLQNLSGKLGVRVNNLDAPEDLAGGEDVDLQSAPATGPMPDFKKKNQGQPMAAPQFPPDQLATTGMPAQPSG